MITIAEYQKEALRMRPLLLVIARRYMGNDDDAEDVVQDILLRMWQMRYTLVMPTDRLAKVLVRNRCIDLLRQRHSQEAQTDDMPQEEQGDDERMELMMRAIDALPEMQQTVLRLRHMEGMEMRDIAELIGTSEVAVRKTLSRARQTLRTQLTHSSNLY